MNTEMKKCKHCGKTHNAHPVGDCCGDCYEKFHSNGWTTSEPWNEIEYGLFTIAAEATLLLKQLNQLRASAQGCNSSCEHICVHCEEEGEKE